MRYRTLLLPMLLLLPLSAPAADKAQAVDVEERNKAVAREAFEEILSKGRLELVPKLYAADFVNHGLQRDVRLEEDMEFMKGWHQAFPDLVVTVEQVIAEGDLVSVLWVGRGTNTGTGNGLPATGKSIQVRGITNWRIVDGKIREEWSAFDQLSLMTQLGLLPSNP